ncbi:Retinoschisin [Branchiostoma belcheri]|nr:Retinoschisin [Branchiostoma belcheri]
MLPAYWSPLGWLGWEIEAVYKRCKLFVALISYRCVIAQTRKVFAQYYDIQYYDISFVLRRAIELHLPDRDPSFSDYPISTPSFEVTETGTLVHSGPCTASRRKGREPMFGHPSEDCTDPLGMESGAIPDDSITASSTYTYALGANKPYYGRLNGVAGRGAWESKTNTIGEWLQVDLGKKKTVTGTIIQGRDGFDEWVTHYKLQYSEDDVSWTTYASSDGSEEGKDAHVRPVVLLEAKLVAGVVKYPCRRPRRTDPNSLNRGLEMAIGR